MGIINSQSRNCYSNPLFSKLKLLKFNDKVLLENGLSKIVSYHQSSTIGSLFDPIFITMRQPHPLIVNYLNLLSALTYVEKKSITINVIDAWNKAQTFLGDTILKDLTKLKQ